jgi:DNA replication and repair protein RecF
MRVAIDSPILCGLAIRDLRGYAKLDVAFEAGPQLVHGPNAAGKTSLLEAIVLLARGRSHRTTVDGELVRWDRELARVEARVGRPGAPPDQRDSIEVALVRTPSGGARKRIRVNGVAKRPALLGRTLRTVVFAPEDMLLVAGSPSLRRDALDMIAGQRSPAYERDLAAYGRALQQRNGLLRLIRDDQASRAELKFWDGQLLEAGTAVREERQRLLAALAGPLAAAHAEIAPDETENGRLEVVYATNAPQQGDETVRDALARRLAETAEKEVWNGTTLVGPHRDDLTFVMTGRPLASFASRGQQRTAILAFKLAEVDLLTVLDGRPPLLLLDDVFSELDPDRRAHLVRRIAALPQAFVTTTTLDDIDPALRSVGVAWAVRAGADGTAVLEPGA